MLGPDALRMNESRRLEKRAEMEHLIEVLMDELNMFTDTGSADMTMCHGVRQTMEKISGKWTEISKDFKALQATTVDGEAKKELTEATEGYRHS